VLDIGEPVQIVDLAVDMIRLSGLRLGEYMEIEFTDVRPGEKLCEELYAVGEQHLPTKHSKILVAEQEYVDADVVVAAIERLTAITEESIEQIMAELARIVPGLSYRPTERRRMAA
jgi:FlaA1/EpsC-like NDP-sugar epimerase